MADNIKKLILKFASDSWQERKNAFDELYSQLSPDVFSEALKHMQTNRNEDFTYWCVKLFIFEKKYALEYKDQLIIVIKKRFKEKCYFIAKHYIPALMIFDDDFSIQALIELFKSPDWKVRQEVSENIIKLGQKIAPFLIKAFQNSKNRNVQYWTMKIFGRLMGNQSIDNLARASRGNNYMMRYYSIIALGETESDKSIPILIKALEDESFLIRASSFEILENMGEKIFPDLERLFKKGHSNLKVSALKLFAKIKGEGSINTIRNLIADLPDRSFYLIAALSEVRSLKSMNLLVDLLLDESWEVKRYAFNQLVKFGLYTINFLRDYINAPDNVIDIELYIWFSKLMVDYPFEARDEIATLLNIHNEDILNVIIETMNPGLVTKEIIIALIPYFGHGKWTLRKKVALYLRKVGKSAIPVLRDYIANSNDDNLVYWSERTLLYLGESLDASVTKIKKNTALINKISEEMNEIKQDITDEDEQKDNHLEDDGQKKKKDILKRIESIENLYLKDIARDIIEESSPENLVNLLHDIKNYVRKSDFTFLLDLYHYYPEKNIRLIILEIFEKIYSSEFGDLIVNLYNFEENDELKLKTLSVVKNDDCKAVIDLAFQEMNNPVENIQSFARKIYFNFNKSLVDNEDTKTTTEDISEFVKAIKENKLQINKNEFLEKIITTDSIDNRRQLIALHEIWFSDKNDLKQSKENIKTKRSAPQIKTKIVEKKVIKEVFCTPPHIKKFLYILILILVIENCAFLFTGKIIDNAGVFFSSASKWVSTTSKWVSSQFKTKEKPVIKAKKEIVKKAKKPVKKKKIEKKDYKSKINVFYASFTKHYNSKDIASLKNCYSEQYKDESDNYASFAKKLDNEIKNLGTTKIIVNVKSVVQKGSKYITTYSIFMKGTLSDGTELDREITESTMKDTLIKSGKSFKILTRKEEIE